MEELHSSEQRSFAYLDENLARVRAEMHAAEEQSGRPRGQTLLLAAVKSADTEEINYLTQTLGVRDIGENRVQQLLSRYDALDKTGVRIHFIGSLQKNKVKYIIDKVAAIHSVDTLSLAEEIDKRARAIGRRIDVFVEINSGREENKGGVLPEDAPAFCASLSRFENLHLVGLMTMAPRCSDPAEYCSYFASTRTLAEEIFRDVLHRSDAPLLSMGMSESYREAIKEGAHIVRVGRQLFLHPTEET